MAGLVEAGAEIFEWVGLVAGFQAAHPEPNQDQNKHHCYARGGNTPAQPGELEHEEIQSAPRFLGERRKLAKFFRLPQFGLQVGNHL